MLHRIDGSQYTVFRPSVGSVFYWPFAGLTLSYPHLHR